MTEENFANEIWHPVPGIEGLDASNYGRIRSWIWGIYGGKFEDRIAKTRTESRILTQTIHRSSLPRERLRLYKNVSTRIHGKRKNYSSHILICTAFYGLAPPGYEVCHEDGNGLNNHPKNLRWDTHVENMKDRDRHGRSAHGERNGNARINETTARLLILKRISGEKINVARIAGALGVSQSTIYALLSRHKWRRLWDKIETEMRAQNGDQNARKDFA